MVKEVSPKATERLLTAGVKSFAGESVRAQLQNITVQVMKIKRLRNGEKIYRLSY
jgi:hypothetical protein